MRRAFVGPALMTLAVLASPASPEACSRPNPGFEVSPTAPATTSGVETTAAESTGPPPDPTTSGESTMAVVTTDVSTTTTTGDPASTGTESSSTGSVMVDWPTDCAEGDRQISGRVKAAADTFLLHEQYLGEMQTCSFGGPVHCEDTNLGKADFLHVLFDDNGSMMVEDDYASLYAVRFPVPAPEFEGHPVDPSGWIKLRVTLRVVHFFQDPNPWKPLALDVYRFAPGDVWEEGEALGPDKCTAPGASFRCRTCMPVFDAETCMAEWTGGRPFMAGVNVMASGVEIVEDPGEGAELTIDFPPDSATWLAAEGMLVVPQSGLIEHVLEIKSKDFDNGSLGPFIEVVHCPPVIAGP